MSLPAPVGHPEVAGWGSDFDRRRDLTRAWLWAPLHCRVRCRVNSEPTPPLPIDRGAVMAATTSDSIEVIRQHRDHRRRRYLPGPAHRCNCGSRWPWLRPYKMFGLAPIRWKGWGVRHQHRGDRKPRVGDFDRGPALTQRLRALFLRHSGRNHGRHDEDQIRGGRRDHDRERRHRYPGRSLRHAGGGLRGSEECAPDRSGRPSYPALLGQRRFDPWRLACDHRRGPAGVTAPVEREARVPPPTSRSSFCDARRR